MNQNQFMYQNQILDGVADTIPRNQNILLPSKWQFGCCRKVFQHHPYQHKNILILENGVRRF